MLVVTGPVHLCLLDSHRSVKALTGWAPACLSAGPPEATSSGKKTKAPLPFQLEIHHPPCLSVPEDGGGGGLWMRSSRLYTDSISFYKIAALGTVLLVGYLLLPRLGWLPAPGSLQHLPRLWALLAAGGLIFSWPHQSQAPSWWVQCGRVTGLGITRPGGDRGSQPEFLSSTKLDRVIT